MPEGSRTGGAIAPTQSAAFRALCNRLRNAGDPRLLAVAGAASGDGADECAVNLAITLAERPGAKVLLVDANPGDGPVAALIGALPLLEPEGVVQEQRLEIRPAPLPPPVRLDFGRVVRAAGQASIDGPRLKANLLDLRRIAYDYIVIATPPVLASSDGNYIADAVDGVVLAARAGRSRASGLSRASERLAPAPVLGVALLDV